MANELMANELKKPQVTLGGVSLAANQGVNWRLRIGVEPYQTVMTVHKDDWETLKEKIATPLVLKIKDSAGVEVKFEELYILHQVASDSPNRTSFLVSDKRWKWQYRLVVRDYNVPRKSGDRSMFNENLPIESAVTVDEYTYRLNSLKVTTKENQEQVERWEAKDVIEDILKEMDKDEEGVSAAEQGYTIDSWPIEDTTPNQIDDDGQMSIQNLTIRDSWGQALSRALGFVPGVVCYIDTRGKTVITDGASIEKTLGKAYSLPPRTYRGQKLAMIDRKKIRPGKIRLYYSREVEMLLEYEDDFGSPTVSNPDPDEPYIENVIPTVDAETEVFEYDPEKKKRIKKTVPPGTWVEMREWLAAMEKKRQAAAKKNNSWPWTFETIRMVWAAGDLDGALGANQADVDEEANFAMRVQALKQHFRQTFRVNRRYMQRIRDMRAVRVGVLDPVTGARTPASVWGEACVIPTKKGGFVAARQSSGDPVEFGTWRNVLFPELEPDPLMESGIKSITAEPPHPAKVNIIDKELGIWRVEWIMNPYGLTQSYVPCHVVQEDEQGNPVSPKRDLYQQDISPMGAGFRVEGFTNGIFLANSMKLSAIVTVVPAAPNNRKQFHWRELDAESIEKSFKSEFRITEGEGPTMEVFVAPNELTARYGWKDDELARANIKDLFGFGKDDSGEDDEPGIEPEDMEKGFTFINERKEVADHAKSYATQIMATFADNVVGTAVTALKPNLGIQGNLNEVSVDVSAAPSGMVQMVHSFPGQQRPINRFSLLPESTRRLILGIPVWQE